MKIAFFTETYHPQINGVVWTIDKYKEGLEKRGHKVYMFAPKPGKETKDVFRFRSIKFKPYPEYMISLPTMRVLKKILEIKPDIIHIQGPFTAGLMGLMMGKLLGIPVVMTYHTHITQYVQYVSKRANYITNKIAVRYVRWLHNRADAISVHTESIKSELKAYGVKKPMYIITTGLPDFLIRPNTKKKNKYPIILHIGRLCREKEVDVVLKEFKKLNGYKLIITSKGPDEKRLKNMAKKFGILKNIEFTGYISDKKRDQLYRKADVFVSPSSSETQGLVALEAMSFGCPIIVRNARGYKDIVKNNYNGMLFKRDSDLSKKIDILFKNDRLRKNIIKNGYLTVKKYSMENTINKIEFLYKKLIKNNECL